MKNHHALAENCGAGVAAAEGIFPKDFWAASRPRIAQVFPIGMAMNKNLTLRMGNCHHRKYIPKVLDLVRTGRVDPLQVLTQREPITAALDAYREFDTRHPGWMKVELQPTLHS